MGISQRGQPERWFVIGAVCHLLVACPAFFVWAPWTTAISVAEAAERYPGQIDPNWRAVTVYHGRPHEWAWGTVGENPAGFATCSMVLGLGVGGFIYCAYRSRRPGGGRSRRTTLVNGQNSQEPDVER
jgi:hypothetical protein